MAYCAVPLTFDGVSRRGAGFVEEAAAAGRSREQPERAIGDGEHGADGVIEFVGDAGSFVN